MNLDPHQQIAVTTDAPRTQLRAGAGSGKTRVLVERVARLLTEGAHPSEILCLTFTRAAAGEMRERLQARLPAQRGLHKLRILTFHSWAANLIREWHDEAGFARNFTIRDEQDRDDLVLFIGRELALKHKSAKRLWKEEVVQRRYYEMLREVQALDYDGLERTMLALLRRPNVVATLRHRWAHVLVDEAQDNSIEQRQILERLDSYRQFVVGDGAQAIYGFRGGDAAGFLNAGEEWSRLDLPTNYRSRPGIVAEANRIAAEMEPPGIQMVASRWAALWPEVREATEQAAVGQIREVEDLLCPWAHCAVLAPTWRTLEEFGALLTEAGIPWRLARPVPDVWESPEMRWLINCLRAAANPEDHLSILAALNAFAVRMPLGDWAEIRAASLAQERTCLGILSDRMPASCVWIVRAIGDGLWRNIACALADELDRLHLETRAAYVRGPVLDAIDRFEHDATEEMGTHADLLDWFATRHLDQEAAAADAPDAVTLATVHAAKGLEWDHVWILDYGWFGGSEDIKRSRYVAVTRARETLGLVRRPKADPAEAGQ